MLVSSRPVLALILTPALLAGCASIPRSSTPLAEIAALDCDRLAEEQALAERTRDAASRARRGAWKAVLPIAVGVRYASAGSALSDAQRRLQLIGARRSAQQCAPAAGEAGIVDLGAEV
ncbi:hypothetical protein [Lysobacter sp. Root667]|uniref:hypothetical protein n=1 Tax=Lysobacter sp. Root667 TaxID=1736581 RepID=UPI000ACBC91C|nr:hypothetical protein [Lysobacter sp. Root667]